MQSGAGKAALVVIGLVVIGVGGYHIYKGASQKFLDDLKVSGGPVLTPIGMTGYIAKGTVLAGAGLLVIVATLRPTRPRPPAWTPRSRLSARRRSAGCC